VDCLVSKGERVALPAFGAEFGGVRVGGFVEQRQERYTHALSHAEQALALFQAVGDWVGETAALNGVGWCLSMLGDHERARAICQQALAIYGDVGNRYGEAYSWDSLGYAEQHLGLYADAITSYIRAIDLQAELGNRVYEATCLVHLGDAYHAADEPQQARDAWQRALAIFDDLHHPDADKVRGKLRQLGPGGTGPALASIPARP
jgi:tetratricopeptide (TPR) repeat protein